MLSLLFPDRTQHYQKRVISDGAEAHRHRSATR